MTGTPGVAFAAGLAAKRGDLSFVTSQSGVIDATGHATVAAAASTGGTVGNVVADIDADFRDVQTNSSAGNQTNSTVVVDGQPGPATYFNATSGNWSSVAAKWPGASRTYLGLHRVDVRWGVGAGTSTSMQTMRNLTVEARS